MRELRRIRHIFFRDSTGDISQYVEVLGHDPAVWIYLIQAIYWGFRMSCEEALSFRRSSRGKPQVCRKAII